jgi:hypothetical protein
MSDDKKCVVCGVEIGGGVFDLYCLKCRREMSRAAWEEREAKRAAKKHLHQHQGACEQ